MNFFEKDKKYLNLKNNINLNEHNKNYNVNFSENNINKNILKTKLYPQNNENNFIKNYDYIDFQIYSEKCDKISKNLNDKFKRDRDKSMLITLLDDKNLSVETSNDLNADCISVIIFS